LRFDTYVEDAALWIQQLQADSRFSSVTVMGHSEGLSDWHASDPKNEADAFVSIAGSAQLHHKFYEAHCESRLPEALWQQNEQILAALEQGTE
jgi:hypothetical protein